ncbi:pyruvate formate lyase family protein [Micromonospora purpureochromogenes]|uniref:pyruvate formate lyase family protein n=1 Tax=Micromonospora purpureochromogenes TaxID=47872 RepID=UPI00340CB35A
MTGTAHLDPWRGFVGTAWRDTVDVADFVRANHEPYTGDGAFLTGPTRRTLEVWGTLRKLFVEERRRGVYDVDAATPSTITAHAPGWIDRERELIVGLQTDAPLRRAIMPAGGLRMVENALAAYGFAADPQVHRIFTTYRKTHNDAVFDAYPADVLAARGSHVITGLPDAYGRGRIIGDYRRVALYGVDRLIAERRARKAALRRVTRTGAVAPTVRFGRRLAERGTPIWIRFVLAPGLTDAVANVAGIADYAAGLATVQRVEVLPFHRLGAHKFAELGLRFPLADTAPPTPELLSRVRGQFAERGLTVY